MQIMLWNLIIFVLRAHFFVPKMVSFLYSILNLGYIMTLLILLYNHFSSITTTNTPIFFNGKTMQMLRPEFVFSSEYEKSLLSVCKILKIRVQKIQSRRLDLNRGPPAPTTDAPDRSTVVVPTY